jgi:hypothetical protein
LKYHPSQGFEAGKRLNFMRWIAVSEKDTAADRLEKRLWDAAAQSRANPALTPQGYSGPILRLSFYDALHDATSRFDFVLANPPSTPKATERCQSLQPA